MPFRASNQLPQDGYDRAKRISLSIRNYLQGRLAQFSSDTTADVIISTYSDLVRWRDDLDTVATIPGILQYAKDQEDDQSYNVGTEFTTLLSSIDSVISNIELTYPADANGYLLDRKLVDKTYEYRTFTPAALSALSALITAVIANIS